MKVYKSMNDVVIPRRASNEPSPNRTDMPAGKASEPHTGQYGILEHPEHPRHQFEMVEPENNGSLSPTSKMSIKQ